MLNSYQGVVPPVTVSEERVVGRFYPKAGTLSVGRMVVKVANAGGDTDFEIRVGATIETVTIPSGDRAAVRDDLAIVVTDGDEVEVWLTAWPVGGLIGPAAVEIGVEDGINMGGTDEPLPHDVFVTDYWVGALGREPDGAELAADVAALGAACEAETFLTQALARIEAVFDLAEFGVVTDTVFVQRVYRAYFNREPSATGQAFWEGELAIGGPSANAANRDAMRAAFGSHRGFINRAALYCRNALTVANALYILGQSPAAYVQSIVTGAVVTGIDVVNYATAALADGATENVSLSMGGVFWRVTRIEVDFAARVRAYYRNAQRTADAARPFETEPSGEHGCIFDMQLLTNLDFDLSPSADGANYDDLASSDAWIAITNKSRATRPIEIILHRRLL